MWAILMHDIHTKLLVAGTAKVLSFSQNLPAILLYVLMYSRQYTLDTYKSDFYVVLGWHIAPYSLL